MENLFSKTLEFFLTILGLSLSFIVTVHSSKGNTTTTLVSAAVSLFILLRLARKLIRWLSSRYSPSQDHHEKFIEGKDAEQNVPQALATKDTMTRQVPQYDNRNDDGRQGVFLEPLPVIADPYIRYSKDRRLFSSVCKKVEFFLMVSEELTAAETSELLYRILEVKRYAIPYLIFSDNIFQSSDWITNDVDQGIPRWLRWAKDIGFGICGITTKGELAYLHRPSFIDRKLTRIPRANVSHLMDLGNVYFDGDELRIKKS